MENINDKIISGILDRIGKIKEELSSLEEEVRRLSAPVETTEIIDDLSEEPIDLSIGEVEIPAAAPQPVVEPEPVAEPEPEPAAAAEAVEEVAEAAEEPAPEPVAEPEPATEPEPVVEAEIEDLPEELSSPAAPAVEPALDILADVPESEPEKKVKATRKKKAVMDTATAETAVMDVMAEKQAWRVDRPGSTVKNIISAISLNDRVLLINSLFKEDPVLFQETITKFNGMGSLDEAINYVKERFADWNLNSEPVYRLMMAVRRKLS